MTLPKMRVAIVALLVGATAALQPHLSSTVLPAARPPLAVTRDQAGKAARVAGLRMGADSAPEATGAVDVNCLAKYAAATGLEAATLSALLFAVDSASQAANVALPAPAVGVLFAFLSLRSRFFSTLNNSRPKRDEQDGKATPTDVIRPKWTPPGIAFPIIWLTITGLRATSAAMIFESTGHLLCLPLVLLVLHLSVGDTWNTVTNVERRLGVSAAGSTFVWASVWTAIKCIYDTNPTAGLVLAPSGVWITVAVVLTTTIWTMNEPRQPLLPQVGDGKSSPLSLGNLFS